MSNIVAKEFSLNFLVIMFLKKITAWFQSLIGPYFVQVDDAVKERAKDPFLGSFALLFVLYNAKAFLILLSNDLYGANVDQPMTGRFEEFQNLIFTDPKITFGLPFLALLCFKLIWVPFSGLLSSIVSSLDDIKFNIYIRFRKKDELERAKVNTIILNTVSSWLVDDSVTNTYLNSNFSLKVVHGKKISDESMVFIPNINSNQRYSNTDFRVVELGHFPWPSKGDGVYLASQYKDSIYFVSKALEIDSNTYLLLLQNLGPIKMRSLRQENLKQDDLVYWSIEEERFVLKQPGIEPPLVSIGRVTNQFGSPDTIILS